MRGLDELEEKEQKVLREIWNRVEDTIVFKSDALIERSEHLELTKRNLLKIIAKFFDSLGMLSPLTIGMKVLFQEVCQSKLEWDEPYLPETLQERWEKMDGFIEGSPACSYATLHLQCVI